MSSDQISVNEVSSTTEGDGVIILDDDEPAEPSTYYPETNCKLMLFNHICAPLEEDDDDRDYIVVFVIWRGSTISKFSFKMGSIMEYLFNYYSKKIGVDYNQLVFKYKNTTIQPSDYFSNIDFVKTDFIVGGFKSDVILYDENEIDNFMVLFMYIRFQFEQVAMPFVVRVEKLEPLDYYMKLYAERLNIPFHRLNFYLNGFLIDGSASPLSLQMEGGDKIHVTCTKQ